MLCAVAGRQPRREALVFGARRLSYAELDERALRLAGALRALGVRRGDRVATLMHNCNAFVEAFLAAAHLGAVFVPLNFRLVAREIEPVLVQCEPRVLLAGEALAETLSALAGAAALPEHVVTVDDRPPADPVSARHPYDALVAAHAPLEPAAGTTADTPQMLVHSSGTTGRPKGALWTHGTTLASCTAKIIDFGLCEQDRTVVFGPLFHVGPLMDLAVPVLLRGGTLVLGASRQFDPAVVLDTLARERITVVTIYPTMWRRVLETSDERGRDLSGLRLLFTGGEPIPVPVLRRIYERFPGAGFVNTYGSTEGGPITTFLPAADSVRKIGSVGRPAFGVEVRIADRRGRALGAGEVGELLVRSPFVCHGYWRAPEATAASLRDGWWHTGDLAHRDEEGFLWLAGRSKDMIISGAENIYPAEVEQAIATLPEVQEVAVIGVPDDDWGEAVVAVVVKVPGSAIDEASVVAHCRRRLAGYKKPRHVRFVDALPRGTTSKVSKDALRAMLAAGDGA